MDVVYYVRPGERNEELRYSLRSLRNLPHERVFVVGHKPSWVTGVEHLPSANNGAPAANAISHLRLACDAVDADEFLVFNDDFYITAPIGAVPPLHAGPLSERRRPLPASLRAARSFLAGFGIRDAIDWTLHIPLVVLREALQAVLGVLRGEEWRVPYGNLTGLQGERQSDVKVRRRCDPIPSGPFLSSSDSTFHVLAPMLRRLFPDPSPYEVAA